MSLVKALKAMSIKRKLMLIMMATSGTAIFLMAFLVVINQAINGQQAIEQQLVTLADVLGSSSTGALTFDDSATGEEILNGLVLKSNVIYAVIERTNGDSFAVFGNASMSKEPHAQQPVSLWSDLFSNRIQVSRDIYLDKERIGKIRIVSTLDALYKDLLKYAFFLAMISIFCFAVIFFFCAQLQKVISAPILNLQKIMGSVSTKKDYSLRVENREENELKALIDSFNHMLEQIQIRDDQLAENSTYLEEIVATRSSQLSDANEKRLLWLESMARFLKHELKNSSVGIKTSLDLIERRSTEKKKVDVYIARARKSMMSMNALLQSAGEASHLEASLDKESQEQLDLGKVVLEHVESYTLIYPDISIQANCQRDLLVAGNEIRLMQLLDKLVSNAVEHCDGLAPIDILVQRLEDKVQLIVADKGDVLPEDTVAMFDLFVSFRTAERQTDENFGLGLYIVKLIAESHQGQVKAYGLNGEEGAVFEVTLPLDNTH
ncbi:MAG: HAMP domain-containing protein [Methyloprofundus sp.]|nr:HAMP domain-containing protein [Methyloprofundus sp.]